MIDQIARAIAEADGARFEDDPTRFKKLALAALKPLARPTEAKVDAAYEAVRFDEHWAVNSRRRFEEGCAGYDLGGDGWAVRSGLRSLLTRPLHQP